MKYVRGVAIAFLMVVAILAIVPAWLFSWVAKKAATTAQHLLGV